MTTLLITDVLNDDGSTSSVTFETTGTTGRELLASGNAKRIARSTGPPRRRVGQSLHLSDEQRATLAIEQNPYLVALCDSEPKQSYEFSEADALDRLAERVIERLDRRSKPDPQLSDLDDVLPADAPPWFHAMFERPAA
jgi:hypothetical protein